MANALIDRPDNARRGDIVTIRLVLSHVMETGYRRDISGKVIPRNIIRNFVCRYDGAEIVRAEFTQAIAANPFLAFTTVATVTGPVTMTWDDDEGQRYSAETMLNVRD
ncbi:MAG TPA: thiosulfate oxidation carrier complex protein SoxZ [Beijerinckiaceae bacterium]|nr:thiosulfate oxidation carrier complex protein SoxZ [Beijerinckiaceae bacterium]